MGRRKSLKRRSYGARRVRGNTQTDKIQKLQRVLEVGKMTTSTRKAIQEIISALRRNDLELAYELTAVKSFLTGSMEAPARYHFKEDAKYNQKVLGDDIYRILDRMHHDLAYEVDRIPSGMMVVTARGYTGKGKPVRSHPIIRMMERERKAIRRRAARG